MTVMIVGQKIELKGSNKFFTYCRKAFGVSRFTYNWCVAKFTLDYAAYCAAMDRYRKELEKYKKSPLCFTQSPVKPRLPTALDYKKEFNALRKEQYPFTYEVTKYASQQAFINFGKAVKAYFDNVKNGKKAKDKNRKNFFPRFKKKSYTSGSFYIGGDQVKLLTGKSCSEKLNNHSKKQYLNIPNFGYVQLKENLRFTGHINSVTISQSGDRLYASFSIEITEEEYLRTHKTAVQHNTAVGIDLGLKAALMLSDGIAIEGPKPLKTKLRKLAKLQRQLACKQHPRTKGDTTRVSRNYIKQSAKVSRLYRSIADIRNDFAHKISSILTSHYEYICMETLNVKGMMANHKLSAAVSDVGFYNIKSKLMYKSEYKHRVLYEADMFYPSSKTCSRCGHIKKDLQLKERVYDCPECGLSIDRDLNAAINLKKIGAVSPELTPVELTALLSDLKRNQITTSSVKAGIR
ncbi:MAG: transposase [Succinivibrio sp.]|nr:transposase [Succinivibrio sp.]